MSIILKVNVRRNSIGCEKRLVRLSRRSTSATGTLSVRIRDFGVLIGVRVAGAGLAAGLSVYIARSYGPALSGEFFYLISLVTVGSVLTRLGLEPYLTSTIATRKIMEVEERGRLLLASVLASCAMLGVLATFLASLHLVAPDVVRPVWDTIPLYTFVPAVFALNIMWALVGYSRARGFAGLSVFLETGFLSLWLSLVLLAARAGDLELSGTSVGLGMALMAPVLWIMFAGPLWAGFGELRLSLDTLHALRGIVRYGSVTISNGLVILIPLLILGYLGRSEEAGLYNASVRVSMLVGAFGVVVKSLVVKRHLTSRGLEPTWTFIARSAWWTLPWVIVSGALWLFRDQVAGIFGPDFADMAGILVIMLLAQCVNVFGFPIETRLVLEDQARILNIVAVCAVSSGLACGALFIDSWGLVGAAGAFFCAIASSRMLLTVLFVHNGGHGRAASMESECL